MYVCLLPVGRYRHTCRFASDHHRHRYHRHRPVGYPQQRYWSYWGYSCHGMDELREKRGRGRRRGGNAMMIMPLLTVVGVVLFKTITVPKSNNSNITLAEPIMNCSWRERLSRGVQQQLLQYYRYSCTIATASYWHYSGGSSKSAVEEPWKQF